MKVLVTGADGFIGSHLTEALVRAGHDVRALVYYNSFNSWGWLDQSPDEITSALDVVAGDIRDPFAMSDAVKDREVVFNLAALISIPYSYRAPASYVDTNVTGTLNLLEAARRHGVRRFVHTSTSEVYGSARFVPMTEDHPLQAQSPYAACKIGADQLALSFHRCFETPVTVIRPFNTYGPRQSERAVIPTIISQLLAGKTSIRLGSLHPTRDFNYVADTVDGFLKTATAGGIDGEVINVGSAFEISIGRTAEVIAETVGVEISIETDGARIRPENSEVDRLFSDNSKAVRMLGWEPAHGGLDGFRRGIAKTIEWFRDPANRVASRHDRYSI